MTAKPKLPPARIARVVDSVRRRLRRVDQKLVPAAIAVLDMMTAAFFTRAIYTAAKFGIADVLSDGPLAAEAIAKQVAANPDAIGRMLRTLASRGIEIPTVLVAYDFTDVGTIVDVGGGHGRLLAAILQRWPQSHGILFDSESVVEGAPAVLDSAGVADRCSVVGGSFFESVPAGGDAYVLKHIVHDWDDSTVLQILRKVRAAMSRSAKLLVLESVVPDDDREHLSKLIDLEMLVVATGRERTADEYAALLRTAGFRFTRVIPTVGPTSIVEAEAA